MCSSMCVTSNSLPLFAVFYLSFLSSSSQPPSSSASSTSPCSLLFCIYSSSLFCIFFYCHFSHQVLVLHHLSLPSIALFLISHFLWSPHAGSLFSLLSSLFPSLPSLCSLPLSVSLPLFRLSSSCWPSRLLSAVLVIDTSADGSVSHHLHAGTDFPKILQRVISPQMHVDLRVCINTHTLSTPFFLCVFVSIDVYILCMLACQIVLPSFRDKP